MSESRARHGYGSDPRVALMYLIRMAGGPNTSSEGKMSCNLCNCIRAKSDGSNHDIRGYKRIISMGLI